MRNTMLAVVALAMLSGCHYQCRWHSHGACIAVKDKSIIERTGWSDAEWQQMIDQTIQNGLDYWASGGIEGWTIVLQTDAATCYLWFIGQGCTYTLGIDTIYVEADPDCPLLYIPHEMGHAVLSTGDPFHWAGGWDTIDRIDRKVACCTPSDIYKPAPDPEQDSSTVGPTTSQSLSATILDPDLFSTVVPPLGGPHRTQLAKLSHTQ